jgi:hypothetical protein
MSKEHIFEHLKVIRDNLQAVEQAYNVDCCVDEIQELIWKIGEDIGEF